MPIYIEIIASRDDQPSDLRSTEAICGHLSRIQGFGELGTSTGRILYPPNTRMKDFSGNIVLLLSNFVPTDDPSISPECFFILEKEGRPNQTSVLMPMRVLGKCMRRYQIFLNDHDAIV